MTKNQPITVLILLSQSSGIHAQRVETGDEMRQLDMCSHFVYEFKLRKRSKENIKNRRKQNFEGDVSNMQ